MKKPKDITDLANRLTQAASTPLVAPAPVAPTPVSATPIAKAEAPAAVRTAAGKRKGPKRSTVPVFLRLSQDLYEHYDGEAVRRTRATGRGVTVQQVILDRLAETSA